MKIDAYAHCGISKYLPVDVVLRVMETAEVDRSVLVQHLGEFDNRYLETVVGDHPGRFVAVALVDHRSANWPDALERIAGSGCFGGIRVPQDASSENIAFCESVMARSLVPMFDLPGGVSGASPLIQRLARDYPRVPVVLSHLGYPEVSRGRMMRGYEIVELAMVPSVAVLLSGQSMFCDYPYAPLADLRDSIISAFGPDRVMWGSNFPEATDEDDYVRDLSLTALLPALSHAGSAAKVTGATARRVFFDRGMGDDDR